MDAVSESAMPSPAAVFTTLLDHIAAGRWGELVELYAPDVVVTNPFAEAGAPTSGRESVEQFFGFLSRQVAALRAEDVALHETTDSEVLVAEFRFVGTSPDGGGFEMPAVFVVRVRDGRIVESRDYMGPRRSLPEPPS